MTLKCLLGIIPRMGWLRLCRMGYLRLPMIQSNLSLVPPGCCHRGDWLLLGVQLRLKVLVLGVLLRLGLSHPVDYPIRPRLHHGPGIARNCCGLVPPSC